MRLKTFSAATMAEAMEMVRQELGDDAIIVSTQRAGGDKGFRVTAALEMADADMMVAELLGEGPNSHLVDVLKDAFAQHGLPARLSDRLINAARTSGSSNPVSACAAALEAGFHFAPLPEFSSPRPLMMVGAPGCGKSIAVAKLAARAVLKRHDVAVITCDNFRAGATAQLAAFTRILEVELLTVKSADSLARAVESTAGNVDLVLLDSPGVNPFKASDMDFLQELVQAGGVEPILVLAAGGDPMESGEIAEAFAAIGVQRLFAARLDTTRRLGGVLMAAEMGRMALSDVSASPHVASGVSAISALSLAQLLVPDPSVAKVAANDSAADSAAAIIAAAVSAAEQSSPPHWTDEAYSP